MEYLTITQVASMADIPETTARRYVASFADHIDSRRYGRITKFRVPATVMLLQRLVQLYQAGKTSEEIAALLADSYPAAGYDGDTPIAAAAATQPALPALQPAVAAAVPPPLPPRLQPTAAAILPPPPASLPMAELQQLLRQQLTAMEQVAAAIESIASAQAHELADIRQRQARLERAVEERAYIIRPPRAIRRQSLWARAGAGTLLAALSAAVVWWLTVVVGRLTPPTM